MVMFNHVCKYKKPALRQVKNIFFRNIDLWLILDLDLTYMYQFLERYKGKKQKKKYHASMNTT
jgi:hypothetical protein